jgi:hypothetical protein
MTKMLTLSPQLKLAMKATMAVLLVAVLTLAAVGLASGQTEVRSQAPTASAYADDAPLAKAFRDAFVGRTGIYDPAAGIVTPEETHFDIELQAAHNGEDIFFRFQVPTPLPSFYHDVLVYEDGKWVRVGWSPIGPEPHGLYEDRINMLVDDGSVKGFANQGGWLTCHDDLRDPFMYASAKKEEVKAHPVLGEIQNREDVRKYIPQSREPGAEWWQFGGWSALSPEQAEIYKEHQANGVFLDLWQWRAHRSNPIGYSDNQYVSDFRRSSPGKSPYTTNWNGETGEPAFMFDPAVTGFYNLNWETLKVQGYTFNDTYFLAEGVNAVPYDPNRPWQNGDLIPRQLLQTPTDSRGAIQAETKLVRDGEQGWLWDVTLWRPMDTGNDKADKAFKAGRSYDAALGIHRLATGSRWHFVSLPFSIGIDVPADVTAVRFRGDRPDWSLIPATTMTLIYPGQTNWQWLTSDEHPGANQVRADSMSVVGCHDEVGLGAANKAIEKHMAGQGSHLSELDGPRSGRLDATNVVFLYLLIAVGTVGGAIGLGRVRNHVPQEEER